MAYDEMTGFWVPDEPKPKESHKKRWIWAGVGLLVLLYAMGSLDVMFSKIGLPTAYTCYQRILGNGLYCDGPWSLNPLPEGAIKNDNGTVTLPVP